MNIIDEQTGELAIEYFHYESPDKCSICDDILSAFTYGQLTTEIRWWAWEHLQECEIARERCHRARLQLAAKREAGVLAGVPATWMAATAETKEE